MSRIDQAPDRTVIDRPGAHDHGDVVETHPAFGKVTLSRITSTPGASLFDSEVQHGSYIQMTVTRAERTRMLKRDWIHDVGPVIVKFSMSEAQWASVVSSFNQGSGTPVTLEQTESDGVLPSIPFEPRLALSMQETADAARQIKDKIDAALAAVEEKPTKANIRNLRLAVDGVEPNITYAAKTLTEHTENVVQKARADIEAMVTARADALGLSEADRPRLALGGPEEA